MKNKSASIKKLESNNSKQKKKSNSKIQVGAMASEPSRSVSIKKANNGFVVSTWNDRGDVINIAKTQDEANKIAAKMLNSKSK